MQPEPHYITRETHPIQLRHGAGIWRLAPSYSRLSFRANTFWGLMTVTGRFSEVAGEAEVDGHGRVMADLRIDVSSVDTGNARRDHHLRSQDFFDVDKFPYLMILVDHVESTGPTNVLVFAHFFVAGTVTSVEFDARIDVGADRNWAEVTATIEMDRTAFGISHNTMGMLARYVQAHACLRFVKTSTS